MQGMGSDPEEFDVVSILARLHEGKEINVNEMHDVEFNEQGEHSDDDIYAHVEMPLVIYTPPQLAIEKTSSPKYFLMVKLVLRYSMKCCISKKKMNFKEKTFPIGILPQYREQNIVGLSKCKFKTY